ncbi:tol-pal system protein YbgF, partial [Pseudomonas aeruginosa]|nr:tol-pal system protein YbgF [Pseudomonas aeruginosa]
MPKHLRVLTFLALSLPLAAWAEVPVYDRVAANNGGNVPPSGYG